jgi:drug/metabolite transporter superfamily protein YnfA
VVQEKVQATEFVKEHLMQLLRSRSVTMQQRLATSLVHLLGNEDLARAYTAYGGGAVLLDLLVLPSITLHDAETWDAALEALILVVKLCQERETSLSNSFVPAPPEEKVCKAH